MPLPDSKKYALLAACDAQPNKIVSWHHSSAPRHLAELQGGASWVILTAELKMANKNCVFLTNYAQRPAHKARPGMSNQKISAIY